jgi:error-prone DNA polymerase
MIDTPRHRSIHPGGFLLGHEPIDSFVPIMPARMQGRTVVQWDKEDIETLGLFKVDLLGLGMLSQIQRCFDLIRRYPPTHSNLNSNGKDHDMLAHIPADDQSTYAMLSKGDSLGVFQVESRAQMNMLPRLKPQCFYDLVVQIAIVRPGPISGEMVHPYLRRRNGLESVVYPHPSLEPVLSRTLGVPLFQEQVMQIAMVVADYTPGEADQLRRDMAAWKRTGQMQAHQERLTKRMKAKGITPEFAERVYEQIKGFGEYGFPESHAASFALISYATAYLKRHFNAHFYAALINAQPMGFYSISTLIYGAQREGIDIRPVDIRYANWECSLEPNRDRFAVRMGLKTIKGIGPYQRQFLDPPPRPQKQESLAQYTRRTQLSYPVLEAMAEAGALDGFGSRRQVLWQLSEPGISRFEPLILEENQTPDMLASLTAMERIAWDQRRTSHSTRGHPFELLRATCNEHGFTPSSQLKLCTHQQRVSCVGLVICRQRPSTASGVTFVTLEDESGFINLVIWKNTAERFQSVLKGSSVLAASGRVQREQDIIHLIVHRLWLPEWKTTIEPVPSHDYR